VGTDSSGRPPVDFLNTTGGHFMQARADNGQPAQAQVQSPNYRNSHTECLFIFYVYMYTETAQVALYPLLKHVELGEYSELDRLDATSLENGAWTKVDIGIGRHRDEVSFHLNLLYEVQKE
jgi:hypothetical protein